MGASVLGIEAMRRLVSPVLRYARIGIQVLHAGRTFVGVAAVTLPVCRMIGDPPPAGMCKIRIRSNGDPQETRVYAVDEHGVEREIIGVMAVRWDMPSSIEPASARVTVCESDVELDAEVVEVRADTRQRERIAKLKAALDRPVKP